MLRLNIKKCLFFILVGTLVACTQKEGDLESNVIEIYIKCFDERVRGKAKLLDISAFYQKQNGLGSPCGLSDNKIIANSFELIFYHNEELAIEGDFKDIIGSGSVEYSNQYSIFLNFNAESIKKFENSIDIYKLEFPLEAYLSVNGKVFTKFIFLEEINTNQFNITLGEGAYLALDEELKQ